MEEKDIDRSLTAIGVIGVWFAVVILLTGVIIFDKFDKYESNFEDIDHRLTAIEQCQQDNDTLHVDILQRLNEVSYELKTMKYGK